MTKRKILAGLLAALLSLGAVSATACYDDDGGGSQDQQGDGGY